MIKEIITNKGIITYKETIPVSGTKYINLEIAKQISWI